MSALLWNYPIANADLPNSLLFKFRDEVVSSVARQRERMEMARTARSKAEECADLLLISLYVLVPPSRACEIRTLEVLPQEASLTSPDMAGKNLVQVQGDGGLTFRFQNYKTVKTYGSDTTILKVMLCHYLFQSNQLFVVSFIH